MALNRTAVRSASSFFLVTFSTAFLFTLGARLTGWFTRAPDIPAQQLQTLGVAIMVAVVALAVGAGIRRLTPGELQSALLGASAVLLSTPLALAVLTGNWEISTAAVSGMGVLTLALGWVVALTRKARSHDEDSVDG
jgi:small-conductance mechanosensitive channel